MRNTIIYSTVFMLGASYSLVAPAPAQAAQVIKLNVNGSYYMYVGQTIARIASGNPGIATVRTLGSSNTDFLVSGLSAGSTSIIVWTADGAMQEYLIVVSPEDPGLALLIENAIDLPNVHVRKMADRVLLEGRCENQYEKNHAMSMAKLYLGDGVPIIDALQMEHPSQIRIEAQILDVSSSDAKHIGIQYGEDAQNSPMEFNVGESYTRNSSDGTKFFHNPWAWLANHRNDFNAYIQALIANNKARVLSRPSISTLSGEPAEIKIGGEIKIPQSSSNGMSYSTMEYGILLKVEPFVDRDNMITTKVSAEVSAPDYNNAILYNGTRVPGKSMRTASSKVTISPGSSMVIGGLIDSTVSKNINKVPLLGDIPILGHFFRYTANSKDKREIMILITPYLVDENTPVKMSDNMKGLYDEGKKDIASKQEIPLNEEADSLDNIVKKE